MIDAIGANIYVNQNSHIVSTKLGNIQAKFDLQSAQAIEALNKQNIEVQKTRPTEATHLVEEQREHERKKHESEEKNAAFLKKHVHGRDEEKEEEPPPSPSSNHLIDIKV